MRRAQVAGELAAERRVAERAARERAERAARIERLAAALVRDRALLPVAAPPRRGAGAARWRPSRARVEVLDAELLADREAGEGVAAALRACATEEAEIQDRLRERGDAVTAAEVRAQQVRDAEHDAAAELDALAARLGPRGRSRPPSRSTPRPPTALRARIERLQRRREQLGPVNPLAKAEYDEALAHVEELERQREDLETALRELQGRSSATPTARSARPSRRPSRPRRKNFEELAEQLFPGGRGRLRLVREDSGPRPVLGGAEVGGDDDGRGRRRRGAEDGRGRRSAGWTPTTTSASRSRSRRRARR